MNDTIFHHAYLVSTEKDTTLIQTKTHRDLLQIQSIGDGTYNLFHLEKGISIQILSYADRQELIDKIARFASVESVEESLTLV